jgi:AcrR family transcriptional regulator
MTADELARMADHVLAHGLHDATLRPLARAAGTSDRMLVYRYGSKDGLIAALLDHLAGRLTAMLEAASLPAAATPESLAGALMAAMRAPAVRPYLALWLEVVAGAARGSPAHRGTAARILTHFHGWIVARLPPGTAEPAAVAAALLQRIEGSLVIASAGDDGARINALATGS